MKQLDFVVFMFVGLNNRHIQPTIVFMPSNKRKRSCYS